MGVGKMNGVFRMSEQMKMFDYTTKVNKNCIRFDNQSGIEHKLAILDKCRQLLIDREDFFTRARLQDNEACADLFLFSNNMILEFQFAETEESIERKRKMWTDRRFNFEVVKV